MKKISISGIQIPINNAKIEKCFFGIKKLNLRAGYFSYKGPDLDLKTKISGLSTGIGINYGYIDVDLGITKYNDFLKNRLYTRGLTNKYDIDKDIYSVYASISIKL